MSYVIKSYLLAPFMRQQGTMVVSNPSAKDLVILKNLIEAGKITPIIDKTYALSDTPAALQYLEQEHARGKVVITIAAEAVLE